jgi:hypothetical protein
MKSSNDVNTSAKNRIDVEGKKSEECVGRMPTHPVKLVPMLQDKRTKEKKEGMGQ